MFMLAVVLFLLLALVWIKRKHKRVATDEAQYNLDHQLPERSVQRETIQQQQAEDEGMEIRMKNNDAYISTTLQITTEDNVA